jgi:hypothetical protein
MSSPPSLGQYHFMAWARRGIGTSVANIDSGSLPDRASLSVQLSLNVTGGAAPNPVALPAVSVDLFGPGDVIGVDPRYVIRTEPRPLTSNFEPNYLCGIEFDTPDFPWLFTPAAPSGDRLHPWVALIVLKTTEFTAVSAPPNPLPAIDVTNVAALQDLGQSWNWAHVQVSGNATLADTLASTPGNAISRLLCPRRLEPETSYSAFLVPAFHLGVVAGLTGGDVSGITTADPAWTSQTTAPLRLPYYYRFQFTTSDAGDFESLVRALTPTVLPPAVGERPMDVSQPDPGIPSAGGPLGLEGALESVSTTPTPWSGAAKDAFQAAVESWINQTSPATDDPANPTPEDPTIVPPIYGRWQAAVQSVDRTAVGWVNDLNLDPRNRSAAGMGTEIVQEERTQLMASAWQQVAGILQANQLLKQAQLARAATQQIYRQHVRPAQVATVLTLTAPLHATLRASPMTVRAAVRASRVPERLLSGTFRRVARLPRHLRLAQPGPSTLLSRVNSGSIAIVPPPAPPGGMVSIDQVTAQVAPPPPGPTRPRPTWLLVLLAIVLLILAVALGFTISLVVTLAVAVAIAVAVAVIGGVLIGVAWFRSTSSAPGPSTPSSAPGPPLRFGQFTPAQVALVPPRPKFQITPAGGAAPAPGSDTGSDSAAATAFRQGTSQLFAAFAALPSNPAPRPSLDLAALSATVLTRIDPVTTVPRRVGSLIALAAQLPWQPVDPLEPIMAAPVFPQPMYVPLRDLSPSYLLPGVDAIPPNSLGLLQTNRRFIESYMVGLNHEMSRQLLWNTYPTDQRGSYFRQFWDVTSYVPQPGDPSDPTQLAEQLKDIPPINAWPLPVALGDHPNRTDIVADNLVLMIRGELFKRYPNAIVYAAKAKRTSEGQLVLDESDERYPLFRGTLAPDMTFLGFNLTAADARGGTPSFPDGFFFVFQEQPSEPRFGLEPTAASDPVTTWSDLAWTHFASGGGSPVVPVPTANRSQSTVLATNPWRLAARVFASIQAAVTLPDFLSPKTSPTGVSISSGGDDAQNAWGINSAQTAYILLRMPFRVLILADLMLPS